MTCADAHDRRPRPFCVEVTHMANKPLRPCLHPGCPALVRDGWCDRHRPPKRVSRRRVSAAWHDWYSRRIWTQRLRPAQLLREPFCRVCAAQGLRTRATVVDHIAPHRGDWALFVDEGNLQSLCKRHHDAKTAREQGDFRAKPGGI